MPVGPQQFGDGILAGKLVVHGGQREGPHGLQFGPGPGEPLSDQRIVDRAGILGQLHQSGKLTGVTDLLAQRGHAALELQGSHRHTPAVAGFPDHQFGVGAGVGEEHLVELRVTGQLDDRADLDTRLVKRHKQIRQTLVPFGALLGSRDDEAPLRPVRQRRPDLLPVDDPAVPVEVRRRRHIGEVAAGTGFGVALAPQFGDVADGRQEAPLLLCGAEGDQRRADEFLTEVVDLVGGVRARVLLVEGDPVRHRQSAPAVLDRPAQAGQPGGGQMPVPGPPFLEGLMLAAGAAEALERGIFTDEVGGQPVADLSPELLDTHPCRVTYQALALLAVRREQR